MKTSQSELFSKEIAAAKICFWFFIGAFLLSLIYIFITGRYNGDFMGVEVTLESWLLLFTAIAFALPYKFLYSLYYIFKRNATKPSVPIGDFELGILFFIVIIWFVSLSLLFDVGSMGKGGYSAPDILMPFIQMTNRISPFYLGVIFIVSYRGSKSTIILGIALLLILGLLRGGLGVFLYVFLALAIRNSAALKDVFRRHFFKILIILTLLPYLILQLYTFRAESRGTADLYADISLVQMIGSILIGRLSSISNSAFIIQEHELLVSSINELDPLYFQLQMLAPILGVGVIPEVIPERILINAFGGNYFDVSYMAGLFGNLAIAWMLSPIIAILNLISIFLCIILSFYLANKIDIPYRNEICFMLLLYPITSGVGNEFSFIVVFYAILIVIFKLIHSMRFVVTRGTKLSMH